MSVLQAACGIIEILPPMTRSRACITRAVLTRAKRWPATATFLYPRTFPTSCIIHTSRNIWICTQTTLVWRNTSSYRLIFFHRNKRKCPQIWRKKLRNVPKDIIYTHIVDTLRYFGIFCNFAKIFLHIYLCFGSVSLNKTLYAFIE